MEFFLQKNSHFEKFVELKIGAFFVLCCVLWFLPPSDSGGGADVLFRDLFNAFHPTACGSLFHWSKVFLALCVPSRSWRFLSFCADMRVRQVAEEHVGDARSYVR